MKLVITADPKDLLRFDLVGELPTQIGEESNSEIVNDDDDELDTILDDSIVDYNEIGANNKKMDCLELNIEDVNQRMMAIRKSINDLKDVVTEVSFTYHPLRIQ